MSEKIDKLIGKLDENTKSLHIARVPRKVKRRFIELANEEFEGDYGFLLMFLMEGLVDKDMQYVVQRIDELSDRVNVLESKPKGEPEGKSVRMLNGKKVRIGGKE